MANRYADISGGTLLVHPWQSIPIWIMTDARHHSHSQLVNLFIPLTHHITLTTATPIKGCG